LSFEFEKFKQHTFIISCYLLLFYALGFLSFLWGDDFFMHVFANRVVTSLNTSLVHFCDNFHDRLTIEVCYVSYNLQHKCLHINIIIIIFPFFFQLHFFPLLIMVIFNILIAINKNFKKGNINFKKNKNLMFCFLIIYINKLSKNNFNFPSFFII